MRSRPLAVLFIASTLALGALDGPPLQAACTERPPDVRPSAPLTWIPTSPKARAFAAWLVAEIRVNDVQAAVGRKKLRVMDKALKNTKDADAVANAARQVDRDYESRIAEERQAASRAEASLKRAYPDVHAAATPERRAALVKNTRVVVHEDGVEAPGTPYIAWGENDDRPWRSVGLSDDDVDCLRWRTRD